ncbi:MAG: Ldh family oxidoreductase [Pirellulales bacterium]|nr:Ldh family oxidoreductase [Pirellulales bacterium]
MTTPNRCPVDDVNRLVRALAAAAGVPPDDASVLADALVDADVHGASTHGVSRLNIYLRRIQKGLIDPAAELHVESRRPAVLVVDARNGLGQVQAVKTLERLLLLAREYGIAAATVRRSQHFGALSYYSNRAAREGMILLAMTNCEPAMSPEGGCEAFFGTNPIAASFPTGKGFPVKIDLATSIIARGNIIAANKAGRPIPEGWALDPEGRPTTDAAAALAGTVLTMAGHKGFALAMLVELFAGVLSGAAIGNEVGSMYKHMDRPQDVGHYFCLVDIAAFMDPGEFRRRIDATIDAIKACRRRPDAHEILVPGERSYRTAEENRRLGIPVGPETVRELRTLCQEYGTPMTLESPASKETSP